MTQVSELIYQNENAVDVDCSVAKDEWKSNALNSK